MYLLIYLYLHVEDILIFCLATKLYNNMYYIMSVVFYKGINFRIVCIIFWIFWIFKLLLLMCCCDSLCAEINMLNACTFSSRPSLICVYVLTVYTLHILINLQLLWLDSTYKNYTDDYCTLECLAILRWLYSIETSYKCSYYSALYSLCSWTYVIIIIKPCNSKSNS